jgi:hypothetical protein
VVLGLYLGHGITGVNSLFSNSDQGWKKPGLKKKTSPVVFFGVSWVFLGFFAQKRGFLGFFQFHEYFWVHPVQTLNYNYSY